MTTPTIEIKADPRTPIKVSLVGVDYELNPPKSALAIKLAVQAKTAGDDPTLVLQAIDEWVDKAFGKKNATAVRKRLDDENDDLDTPHLMQLMEAVIEASSGNPTSSPSG